MTTILNNISDAYIGSNQVSEIWLGPTKIWPTTHDYSQDYFTLEVLTNGDIQIFEFTGTTSRPTVDKPISYKVNNGNWTTINMNDGTWNGYSQYLQIKLGDFNVGDKISIKSNGWSYSNPINYYLYPRLNFIGTANIKVSGNIMSLLHNDNFVNKYDFNDFITNYNYEYSFHGLFSEYNSNTAFIDNGGIVVDVENLILPATTLAVSVYMSMFEKTAITIPPILSATNLAHSCYAWMFSGCTNLTSAPSLPATTLPQSSFSSEIGVYEGMFENCTSLTTPPSLPATTLSAYCYRNLFSGCTNLTSAPSLPATILKESCYWGMFKGTSIRIAPRLQSTTLARSCYMSMFENCANLTSAPSLPATTLVYNSSNDTGCYEKMFYRCTSLTTAPSLPATTLVQKSYSQMFQGCSNLKTIRSYATDISATDCLKWWTSGVSSTGTFYKDANTTYPSGANGIPSGWTIQNI